MSVPSEPSSPQSSTRTRSPSPDDILERVAADVKEYERENVDTFEASVKAKHNLMTEQNNGEPGVCSDPTCLCSCVTRGYFGVGIANGIRNVGPAELTIIQ